MRKFWSSGRWFCDKRKEVQLTGVNDEMLTKSISGICSVGFKTQTICLPPEKKKTQMYIYQSWDCIGLLDSLL